jgi:hypothetical protein
MLLRAPFSFHPCFPDEPHEYEESYQFSAELYCADAAGKRLAPATASPGVGTTLYGSTTAASAEPQNADEIFKFKFVCKNRRTAVDDLHDPSAPEVVLWKTDIQKKVWNDIIDERVRARIAACPPGTEKYGFFARHNNKENPYIGPEMRNGRILHQMENPPCVKIRVETSYSSYYKCTEQKLWTDNYYAEEIKAWDWLFTARSDTARIVRWFQEAARQFSQTEIIHEEEYCDW